MDEWVGAVVEARISTGVWCWGVLPWMTWVSPLGVRGLSPVGGCSGCPVAIASSHERAGQWGRRVATAACQVLVVRQRAGAGGRWLEHGLVYRADGRRTTRPAALHGGPRVRACVAAYTAAGGAAAVPLGSVGDQCRQRAGVRGH